jgi:nucleotide-binding universal stress UspA family protein
MIKDIIVNLGLGQHDPAGDFAISLAENFDAHILGVAFAYDPIIPVSDMGGIPPDFIDSQRAEADESARTAVYRFEKATKRAGISSESLKLDASISGASDRFAKMARRFDLAVVGQPEQEKSSAEILIDEGVLLDSGHPVLVIPYIQKQGLKLDRIIVCWDGSRAASRAITDAMPLLRKAKQVDVVMVSRKAEESDEVAGADLGQHLARHGLKVDLKRMISPDTDVAAIVLSYAADSSADMIVMGGYGHSRLREFVLGGATRGILSAMTVPTLLSH